jgi:hypothetical protein
MTIPVPKWSSGLLTLSARSRGHIGGVECSTFIEGMEIVTAPNNPVNANSTVTTVAGVTGTYSDPSVKVPFTRPILAGGNGSATAEGIGVCGGGSIGVQGSGPTGVQGIGSGASPFVGVQGTSTQPNGIGVYGDVTGAQAIAVKGENDAGIGVWAQGHVAGYFAAATNKNNDGNALQVNDANDEDALVSNSNSAHHAAVSAHNNNGGFAFWGASSNTGGIGIYANGQSLAAQFGDSGATNGNVQVNGTLNVSVDIELGASAGDFAEEFDLTGCSAAEPGTVMVLDGEGAVTPSSCAYDRKAAGIVSGAGEYRAGIVLDKRTESGPRRALALVGKVYCKVDAGYAPIEIGDMLTTSPTYGHAMKATDAAQSFGAVIGKALRPLAAGAGMIPVLVALQ